ncbi:UDP-N-acetylglucosamine 1-carboxyvinyltransferase [Xylanivirga thermophila]|uniref:UDP-N-acetylglucosamine 1-carboxyvinyltransferase n=1 Tax=Xylanivirga thermophila TaxID=2496273 RepID=UPI00101C1DF6|nr:UDP-N-acetylglucosamine 1-carboxyvinyltransferase [Xylanivirga thermophila]
MDRYIINGGNKLNGIVRVDGAKNAILPILASVALTDKQVILHDCPQLSDVNDMLSILKSMGCKIKREGHTIILDPSGINEWRIPDYYVKKIRSSIVILGAVLGRMGKSGITYPGGCEIGQRPIDLHLKGLRKLGVEIDDSYGYLNCTVDTLRGADIHLDYPSVGATENIMLAASKAKGTTVIRNAAKEPEIVDLQDFINAMGGRIGGAGTDTVVIEGVKAFKPVEYRVIPDRIATGTFMVAAAITGGDVFIDNVIESHVQSIIYKLRETGCGVLLQDNGIRVKSIPELKAIDHTKTLPYPGFPSDMQAPLMAMLTRCNGTSIVTENIFENRYKHVPELKKMGANIRVESNTAIIQGVDMLMGARMEATDLRGGAALVIAALDAQGASEIGNINHIDRGYEGLECKLKGLGAKIERIKG